MRNLSFYLVLCFGLVVYSCNKDEFEINNENYEDSNFEKKHLSNSKIKNVAVYPLGKGGGQFSVMIGFENLIPSKQVDFRIRRVANKGGVQKWYKIYNVKSPFLVRADMGAHYYEIQFSYVDEYWLSGGYDTYRFTSDGNVHFSSSRFSNLSITNVKVVKDDGNIGITFDQSLTREFVHHEVDIRYRKSGTSNWTKKYNINSGFRFEGINSLGTYEFQLSYKNEYWSWGGYKTYKFEPIASNVTITNVNVSYGGNRREHLYLRFNKSLSKNVDVRYRKLGTSNWTKIYNVKDGYITPSRIDVNKVYEVQFSYADEYWSGGYKTYRSKI